MLWLHLFANEWLKYNLLLLYSKLKIKVELKRTKVYFLYIKRTEIVWPNPDMGK